MKIIQYQWCDIYTGLGYLQGIGFNVQIRKLMFWVKNGRAKFEIITDIRIQSQVEWLENLKKRLAQ